MLFCDPLHPAYKLWDSELPQNEVITLSTRRLSVRCLGSYAHGLRDAVVCQEVC